MDNEDCQQATLAEEVNESLAYVRQFAPSLVAIRASLLPFEGVIMGESAGPQEGVEDEDEEPYFTIQVPNPLHKNHYTEFSFTAKGIEATEYRLRGKGNKRRCEPVGYESDLPLTGVFSYLRQLPRPFFN